MVTGNASADKQNVVAGAQMKKTDGYKQLAAFVNAKFYGDGNIWTWNMAQARYEAGVTKYKKAERERISGEGKKFGLSDEGSTDVPAAARSHEENGDSDDDLPGMVDDDNDGEKKEFAEDDDDNDEKSLVVVEIDDGEESTEMPIDLTPELNQVAAASSRKAMPGKQKRPASASASF